MRQTTRAVFENGVFPPLESPTGIAQQCHVALTVSAEESSTSLADCVNRISDNDAREMLEIVNREFESVSPYEGSEIDVFVRSLRS